MKPVEHQNLQALSLILFHAYKTPMVEASPISPPFDLRKPSVSKVWLPAQGLTRGQVVVRI